jgi:polysaccharide pyruvyl transferase WcaK-like protein
MAQPERAFVLKGDYGPRQILGLMEHLGMVVGMRLHFLIFAAIARIPFVALPYAGKVAGFLQDLGLPARVLQEQHAGPLLALIDRLWDHRASFREALDRNMPSLEERARGTARTIARFLETRADEESGTTAPATVG